MTSYRKDIDGLRAISIIFVILYHSKDFLKNSIFEGGYIGVDIFFVISGYLITKIILEKENKFSFFQFYNSRFKRLLPALTVGFLLSFLISLFFFSENSSEDFHKSHIFSSLFLSNFYFLFFSNDYFSTNADYIPLIHTWSLGIEAQFYLLFPIFIFLFTKFNKVKLFFILLTILSFLSITYAQLGGNFRISHPFIEEELIFFNQPFFGSFYSPLGRIWEISLGSIVAYFKFKKKIIFNSNVIDNLAFIFLCFSFFIFNDFDLIPNIKLLIPLLCTSVIILNESNSMTKRFLSLKPIYFIGLISYSLYIYHHIFFSFIRIIAGSILLYEYILLILAIFFLSYLSYKFVELPVRKDISNKKLNRYFLVYFGLIVFSLVNILTPINKLLTTSNFNELKNDINFDTDLLLDQKMPIIYENLNKKYINNNKINILIIGDSMAEDLFLSLYLNTDNFNKYNISLYNPKLRPREFVLKDTKLKNKIKKFYESNLFLDSDIIIISNAYYISDNKYRLDDIEGLNHIINNKIFNEKKIILSGPQPSFYTGGENIISFFYFKSFKKDLSIFKNISDFNLLSTDYLRKEILDQNIVLKKYALENNLNYIDKLEVQCGIKYDNCTNILENNDITILDNGHYTIEGAKYFGVNFFKIIDNFLYTK